MPTSSKNPETLSPLTITGDAKAIAHLKQAVASGTHWYLALLEAVKYWKSAEEDYKGRHYIYLIGGEAFDWLTLAERLCQEISDSVTEAERINLLFFDQPPLEIPREKFKRLIGPSKYRAYLNYLYGVLVEEALVSAVVDEIRKERRSLGLNKHEDVTDKAYRRIYGATQEALLEEFRKEKKYPRRNSMSLTEHREFTYWLFQHRLKVCDKSRVASDTKKALVKMHRDLAAKKPPL
jgi:hypothetical protein